MKRTIGNLAAVFMISLSAPAWACGGFFCSNNQPVNQSAERILFAHDGEMVHMHVQIQYAGPPSKFGWILPVPSGGAAESVKAELSTEELFRQLDANYAPIFRLNRVFEGNCPEFALETADGGVAGGRSNEVQVLSREAMGPYDRTILTADTVDVLRVWLDENGYDIPEAIDAKMEPYVGDGRVFIALKLLPEADTGDIAPLRVSFLADQASIPIIPTAVAAEPDMGLLVHVLGSERAIPLNYRHVEINEAAINWQNGGQNYADVVSQAIDEAGGQGFTTDYAGDSEALAGLTPIAAAQLTALRDADGASEALSVFAGSVDADLIRILDSLLDFPGELNAATVLQCVGCFDEQLAGTVTDGEAIAARIETEINGPREQLAPFLQRPYLTRLYTTMSPDEMTEDPIFSFNADLPNVDNLRQAEMIINCDDPEDQNVISLDSGASVTLEEGVNPNIIGREAGVTTVGVSVQAAILIEQLAESGLGETIEDRRDDGTVGGGGDPPAADPVDEGPAPRAAAGDAGCACRLGHSGGFDLGTLVVFGLATVLRWRTR